MHSLIREREREREREMMMMPRHTFTSGDERRFLEATSGGEKTVALTSARAIKVLVQAQNLPHVHQALPQPQGHDIAVQLRAQDPPPLPLLLLVVVLGVHVLGAPGARPGTLRRAPAPRAVEVRGVRDGHLVDVGPAGHDVVDEAGEGVAEVGARHRHGALAQQARAGGRAVEEAAAEAGVVAHGALGPFGVPGAHGEGAVAVVEVGCFASGDVAAGAPGPEGGTAGAGVSRSLHCSCCRCGSKRRWGEDVAEGDVWLLSCTGFTVCTRGLTFPSHMGKFLKIGKGEEKEGGRIEVLSVISDTRIDIQNR